MLLPRARVAALPPLEVKPGLAAQEAAGLVASLVTQEQVAKLVMPGRVAKLVMPGQQVALVPAVKEPWQALLARAVKLALVLPRFRLLGARA